MILYDSLSEIRTRVVHNDDNKIDLTSKINLELSCVNLENSLISLQRCDYQSLIPTETR